MSKIQEGEKRFSFASTFASHQFLLLKDLFSLSLSLHRQLLLCFACFIYSLTGPSTVAPRQQRGDGANTTVKRIKVPHNSKQYAMKETSLSQGNCFVFLSGFQLPNSQAFGKDLYIYIYILGFGIVLGQAQVSPR